jgi:uncharacterized membrane protein
MEAEVLVRDYLARLEAAASALSSDRRGELVVEVREHIESALAEAGRRDEVTTRNVLERLGAPEEIVAAETEGSGGGGAAALIPDERRSPWGPIEVLAILLLTAGAIFLPVVGPIIGLALVWLSRAWTTRQKAIATIIAITLMVILPLGLLSMSSGSGGIVTGP